MLCKRTALYLDAKSKDPGHNSLSSPQCSEVAAASLLLWFTVGRDTSTDTSKTGRETWQGRISQVLWNNGMGCWVPRWVSGAMPSLESRRKGAGPSAWRCSAVPHLGYLTNWHSAHWVSDSACQIHAVPHCSSRGRSVLLHGCQPGHTEGKEAQQLLLTSEAFST